MLPDTYSDLLDAPNTAILATILPNGGPQASPVWFLHRDGHIMVSTAKDRLKHRNVTANPQVSFTVVDPQKPLRYIEVRGTATISDDPNCEIRDAIAVKHGFADGSAFDTPGTQRVTFTIEPTRIIEH